MSGIPEERTDLPAASWVAGLLHGWANQIAARFNQPVYLVGSALVEAKPRDTDVVVILPDAEFFARYGLSGLATQTIGDHVEDHNRRYWNDIAKLSAWCNRHHGNGCLNVDLKVQDESQCKARKYDPAFRIRLDSLDVPQTGGSEIAPLLKALREVLEEAKEHAHGFLCATRIASVDREFFEKHRVSLPEGCPGCAAERLLKDK